MNMEVKRFDSSEGNVWKYVFDFGDAVAEAVLYRYLSAKPTRHFSVGGM